MTIEKEYKTASILIGTFILMAILIFLWNETVFLGIMPFIITIVSFSIGIPWYNNKRINELELKKIGYYFSVNSVLLCTLTILILNAVDFYSYLGSRGLLAFIAHVGFLLSPLIAIWIVNNIKKLDRS